MRPPAGTADHANSRLLLRPAHALAIGAAVFLLVSLVQLGAGARADAACKHRRAMPHKTSTSTAARAIRCLINKRRTGHGLAKLRGNSHVATAARRHSRYMQRHSCFSHQCPGEPSLLRRVAKTGYMDGASSYGCGENLAMDRRSGATPRKIVHDWMNSPPHRSVILSSSFEHLGVGLVWGDLHKTGANAGIYTADFCYRNG